MKKNQERRVKVLEYNALFSQEEEGGFSVIVPDLPGCISQGDTFEEAKQNIAEAMELYLEDADEDLYHETAEDVRKQFFAPIQVSI